MQKPLIFTQGIYHIVKLRLKFFRFPLRPVVKPCGVKAISRVGKIATEMPIHPVAPQAVCLRNRCISVLRVLKVVSPSAVLPMMGFLCLFLRLDFRKSFHRPFGHTLWTDFPHHIVSFPSGSFPCSNAVPNTACPLPPVAPLPPSANTS